MKRLPLMFLLAAGLAAATAQAQTTAEQTPTTTPATQDAAKAAESATHAADADKKLLSEANCVRETGSRITRRDGKSRCTGQPGRAYTKDDLNSTGHLNLSDALRTLDPSIR
ncbi:hypothetical protein [Pseudoxanthomonas sp. PXM02]|uniref:hypothetical protein n=1 Tax=Pseudoxanthomonas sp. PXM02 TaxID=2769294 RepID=UPI00177E2E95|nr:hypothetical protein [Pseudoxanthomonas sp. PXM02]MBD9478250.1 hypothetical protein [Pseudoxanthomonas sp. PXM02]